MTLTVNGERRDLPEGLTLDALLRELELPRERVAVELNRELLPRARFAEAALRDGDKVEIVHFVGGG